MIRTFLLLSTALILLQANPSLALGQVIEPSIYKSSYSSEGLKNESVISGNWFIDPSSNLTGYESEPSKSGEIEIGQKNLSNYSIYTDIQPVIGEEFYIKFRNDTNRYYKLILNFNPLEKNNNSKPTLSLIRNEDGKISNIAENNNFPLLNNELYHIEIRLHEKKIRISIDEIDVMYIYDIESTVKTGNILIGFNTGDYGLSILNIKSIKISK